jgi:hypothetical protein
MLEPRPTPKMEDYHLSAVRDLLFNIFAATLYVGGRSSIRNLRTRHVVVTGIHLSQRQIVHFFVYKLIYAFIRSCTHICASGSTRLDP